MTKHHPSGQSRPEIRDEALRRIARRLALGSLNPCCVQGLLGWLVLAPIILMQFAAVCLLLHKPLGSLAGAILATVLLRVFYAPLVTYGNVFRIPVSQLIDRVIVSDQPGDGYVIVLRRLTKRGQWRVSYVCDEMAKYDMLRALRRMVLEGRPIAFLSYSGFAREAQIAVPELRIRWLFPGIASLSSRR